MGGGSWTTCAFNDYTYATKGMSAASFTSSNLSTQEVFKSYRLNSALDPKNVMRECCDSEEHPNSTPIILALDVTGSMGAAATKVAKKLNEIMTDIYGSNEVTDPEFCIMAIGDLYCDRSPIQISQFESDTRIAEQLDKVYFEFGGGGNKWESYTAAWYMGLKHCKLDCWNRNKKGIIITLGDEQFNPYLQAPELNEVTGDTNQTNIDSKELYKEAIEKFDIYHISVNNRESSYSRNNRNHEVDDSWINVIGKDNYFIANLDNLSSTISNIVTRNTEALTNNSTVTPISW